MHDKTPYLLFASAAALSLALSQAAMAQTSTTPAAQAPAVVAPPAPAVAAPAPAAPAAAAATPAPVAPAPEAAAPSPAPVAATEAPAGATAAAAHADAAAKRMEERRAEMMAKRKQRYEELRKRAETAGLNLPEAPPWDEAGFTPPEMPEMPEMPAWASPPGMEGMDQEWMARHEQAMQAMRERAKQRASAEGPDQAPWNMETAEEHRAHMEKMRNATPEERAALRDQHWAEMRERAAAKGITMPETPPWKEAEQRREARRAQWESYRKIVDQMSAEQREAAEAMFGQPPMPPWAGHEPAHATHGSRHEPAHALWSGFWRPTGQALPARQPRIWWPRLPRPRPALVRRLSRPNASAHDDAQQRLQPLVASG